MALTGLVLLLLLVAGGLVAPLAAPAGYDDQDPGRRLQPPLWHEPGGATYVLGTDELGRDLLARLLYGARLTLVIAAAGVFAGGAVGVALGLIAGFYAGRIGAIIMRLADVQLAFPGLLLALATAAVLGASATALVIVLSLTSWVIFARTVRGVVLTVKEQEYVQAAIALGAGHGRVLARHVLPNVLAPILVLGTVEFAQLIFLEATLSFLGLGIQPPYPSWGGMLATGRDYMQRAWWLATFPGLAIMFAVLGANLLGDGLRDALDPRLRPD